MNLPEEEEFKERRWRYLKNKNHLVALRKLGERTWNSWDGGKTWEHDGQYYGEFAQNTMSFVEETFDHLPFLPEGEALASTEEKNEQLTQRCPMDVCLAPQRLKVLEDFYEEIQRIISEENGSTRVQAAISNALRKVEQV